MNLTINRYNNQYSTINSQTIKTQPLNVTQQVDSISFGNSSKINLLSNFINLHFDPLIKVPSVSKNCFPIEVDNFLLNAGKKITSNLNKTEFKNLIEPVIQLFTNDNIEVPLEEITKLLGNQEYALKLMALAENILPEKFVVITTKRFQNLQGYLLKCEIMTTTPFYPSYLHQISRKELTNEINGKNYVKSLKGYSKNVQDYLMPEKCELKMFNDNIKK